MWVARDRTGVLLAVKVVEPAHPSGQDHGEREERALALVRQRVPRHPHLVSILHVSRRDGRLVYTMDLADPACGFPSPDQDGYQADTLAQRIAARGQLPLHDALSIALDLLGALEALHEASLVHRDVKPGNVIFVGGVSKLADVGLATVVETGMSLAGTAGYVPLDGSTGPDADLYALGKLLYQAVTGQQPADFPAVPGALLTGPDAAAFRRLNRVLLRACAPTKSERFRSAGELRRALEAVCHPPPSRRRKGLLLAGGVLVVLLGCWLAVVGIRSSPQAAVPAGGPVYFRPGDDASAAQKELARQLGEPVVLVNSLGMPLALIPAGDFQMGSPVDEEGRSPEEVFHPVQIRRPFYLGVYEVTQEEYAQVRGDNPSRYIGPRQPVERVSWNDAVAFCQKLSRQEGQSYRLPTEAEWEYACRAGTTTRTYLGQSIRPDQANVQGRRTQPVGQYAPNPFGLYDMIGNVYEWCSDWHSPDYYQRSPLTDPPGPEQGERRVLRGAGWFDGPGTREQGDRRVRSAYRGAREPPDAQSNRVGFRVLREIEQPPAR